MSKWSSEERTERICVTFMFLMKTANPGESSDKVRLVYSHMHAQGPNEVIRKKKSVQLQPIDK